MASAATLEIILQAKDQASGTLKGLSNTLGGLGGNLQTLGQVAITSVAAMAALGAGLGAIIVKSTMSAAKVSELRAVLGVLGERAGWSAGEIDANIRAMTDLGITSDVAISTLNEFARQQLSVTDATMAARAAQDLAVLSQRDSSETLQELIYGIKTQNSGLQVFRDLGIQAGTVLKAYAAELGVTVGELTETQRQQAMLNAVQEEAIRIQGLYTAAMEEPSKQLRSFPRYFQEIAEAIGGHFLPAFGQIVFGAAGVVKSFQGLLNEGEPLERIFAAMGGAVEAATGALFGMLPSAEGVAGALGGLATWVEAVLGPFESFFGMLEAGVAPALAFQYLLEDLLGVDLAGTIMEWIGNIQSFIGAVQEAVQPITDWIGQNVGLKDVLIGLGAAILSVIIPALVSIVSAVTPVIAVFVAVVAAVAVLRAAWENNFLGIQDITSNVITFIRGFITNALDFLKGFWADHHDSIKDTVRNAFETIRGIIEGVITFVRGFIEGALGFLQGLWDTHGDSIMATVDEAFETIEYIIEVSVAAFRQKIQTALEFIQTFWAAHGEHLMRTASYSWEQIKRVIDIAITLVLGIIRTVMAVIRGDWEGAWAIIQETAASVWATLQEIVAAGLEFLRESIGRIMGDAQMTWSEIWGEISAKAAEIWEDIKAAVSSGASDVLAFVKKLIGDIKAWFTDTDWGALGRSIIEGIASGVSGAARLIRDAVVNAARAAWDAAKGFIGMDSPAKLFIPLGESIPEGIAVGIEGKKDMPLNAMQGVVDDLVGLVGSLVKLSEMLGQVGGPPAGAFADIVNYLAELIAWVYRLSTGYIRELVSAVSNNLEPATNAAMDAIADATKSLTDMMGGLLKLASVLGNLTIGTITEYSRVQIAVFFAQLGWWFTKLHEMLGHMANYVLPRIDTAASGAMDAVAAATKSLTDMMGGLLKLAEILNALSIGTITEYSKLEIAVFFIELGQWFTYLYNALDALAKFILGQVDTAAREAMDAVTAATKSTNALLQGLLDFNEKLGDIASIEVVSYESVKGVLTALEAQLDSVVMHLSGFATTGGDLGATGSALAAITAGLDALASQIMRFGSLTVQPIVDQLNMMRDVALTVIATIKEAFIQAFRAIGAEVRSAIMSIIAGFYAMREAALSAIVGINAALDSIPREIDTWVHVHLDDPHGLVSGGMGLEAGRGGGGSTLTVNVPINLDGREIGRAVAHTTAEELRLQGVIA